jgi:hypothetical protein
MKWYISKVKGAEQDILPFKQMRECIMHSLINNGGKPCILADSN